MKYSFLGRGCCKLSGPLVGEGRVEIWTDLSCPWGVRGHQPDQFCLREAPQAGKPDISCLAWVAQSLQVCLRLRA